MLINQADLLNSTIMQLILSAPNPSEAAKFIGQIFSIINSIILDKLPPGRSFYSCFIPFFEGLFEGDFLEGELAFYEDFLGESPPLLNLFLYSYTKSTAC